MTAARLAGWLGAALVAATVGGCVTTTPARYYTLESTATATGAPATDGGVLVGPVSVPAEVDRPELVVRVAPNRVEVEEYDRWAAPLGEGIASAVAGDLAVLLGTPEVATAPFANFSPAWRVTIDVQRFESRPGDSARIEAVWALRRTRGGEKRSGRSVVREAVHGGGFDALAAAHSRALAALSGDIAAAIREAEQAP